MTGAGALPFAFVRKIGDRTIGWSNAAAARLMLATSHSLIAEGDASLCRQESVSCHSICGSVMLHGDCAASTVVARSAS